MRIAQVAPLYERVPPVYYGGTERVVSYLTEELVRQGHEVTLFASGDSITRARLVAPRPGAIRLDGAGTDPVAAHVLELEQVLRRAEEFDVVHFHVDHLHFPAARRAALPSLTTLHGRLDLPGLAALFSEFRDMPVVSISRAQRGPLPMARWAGTVYHGLPADLYAFREAPGDYFAFLGRVSPEKGLDQAIRIARRLRRKLRVAAKIDAESGRYFDENIRPFLADPLVEFLGEIGEEEKGRFLGEARALLFPVRWPEPFGLAMIESLACGTPVLAYGVGSVPEIVEHGETGFIVRDEDEAVAAADGLDGLDRRRCRQAFERRFSAARMARDYVALYERVLRGRVPGEEARA